MKNPSKAAAIEVIKEWPDQDDFICRNVRQFMNGGEPDDNSIQLAQYWSACKRIANN